ncbi:MAG: FAD-binding oxidoreductase, partial [Actinomycetota bacterium]
PVMFVAQRDSPAELDRAYGEFSPLVPDLRRLTPEEVHAYVPAIPPGATAGALLEPGAFDLDVHAILTSYSTSVRKHDGRIITGEAALEITRTGSSWSIRTPHRRIEADVIVNAAGPWGDEVAVAAGVRPLGLTPLKRSVFTFDPGVPTTDWPMVVDIGERWYFKPEGPHILGSAASEIPEKPGDAHPDEIDVALGIERINQATTLAIRSVKNQWAGLRTFTRDRIPAVGRDPEIPNFFWLVGQGGYGIHTSPGIGALSAGLLLDGEVPEIVADHGVTAEMFDPGRFR